jgi:hypothetical protein
MSTAKRRSIDAPDQIGHYWEMRGFYIGVVLAACGAGAFGCGSVQSTEVDAAVDAAGDSAVDVMPDTASPPIRYDVGYVDNLTLTPDITGVFGFVAVVNMGTAQLNLSTASVVTFIDDNANVEWSFAKEKDSTAMLSLGRAAGFLTLAAKSKVLANGVVIEPFDDEILSFSMNFVTPLPSGASLNAQAVISIDNVNVTLPFTINIGTGVQFNSARRVSARP